MKISALLSLIFSAKFALAATLAPVGTSDFKIPDTDVSISKEVDVEIPGKGGAKTRLQLTGAGIRKKKVVLVKVKVYAASHYASQDGKVKAMRMHFLRTVSADQIKGAFGDSLKANGLDPESVGIKSLLAAFQKELPEHSELTFLSSRNEAKGQTVWIEGPNVNVESRGEALADDFWKIWFGKPADSGLEELQEKLLGKNS